MHFPTICIVAVAFAHIGTAHPGHDVKCEIQQREIALQGIPRDLNHCAEKMRARGLTADAGARRAKAVREARMARGLDIVAPFLKVRDAPTVLATDHKSNISYNAESSQELIFSGVNSCVLQPETTEGPYWIANEYIRSDIRDGQLGVELILDTQIIDFVTCEPVSNTLVELWQSNSTGVYGGVVKSGNGAGVADPSNAFNPMLRGLQHTDTQGVAQFTTIFPGHYRGRTPHIHVLTLLNGDVLPDGHYAGGAKAHVGQLFFDQNLITAVEETAPYSGNTQTLTLNEGDAIFMAEAASSDPVVNYSLLGNNVEEGIFGWVAFAINSTKALTINQAGSLGASVTVSNAGEQVTGNP